MKLQLTDKLVAKIWWRRPEMGDRPGCLTRGPGPTVLTPSGRGCPSKLNMYIQRKLEYLESSGIHNIYWFVKHLFSLLFLLLPIVNSLFLVSFIIYHDCCIHWEAWYNKLYVCDKIWKTKCLLFTHKFWNSKWSLNWFDGKVLLSRIF